MGSQAATTPERLFVRIRTTEIPIFPRIINYGLYAFEKTAELIDRIESDEKEWLKVSILVNDVNYLNYLANLCGVPVEKIVCYLNDFAADAGFRKQFSKNLEIMSNSGLPTGDLRFHSLSIYAIVRAMQPALMVETGVAHGKSSAMTLLAMEHNRKGKLISIDLPNPKGNVLPDGAETTTGDWDTGWIVPDYLRHRWDLRLGNALDLMPKLVAELPKGPDIFFHDSLHTYEHVKFEVGTIMQKMPSGMIVCDDIELGVGDAVSDFLDARGLVGHAYRELVGFRF